MITASLQSRSSSIIKVVKIGSILTLTLQPLSLIAFSQHCLQGFTEFKPITSYVCRLSILTTIKGISTVQYNIIDDKGIHTTLSISNSYYVPDLEIKLLSPQQVCSQYDIKGSYGKKNYITLRWITKRPVTYTSPPTTFQF